MSQQSTDAVRLKSSGEHELTVDRGSEPTSFTRGLLRSLSVHAELVIVWLAVWVSLNPGCSHVSRSFLNKNVPLRFYLPTSMSIPQDRASQICARGVGTLDRAQIAFFKRRAVPWSSFASVKPSYFCDKYRLATCARVLFFLFLHPEVLPETHFH